MRSVFLFCCALTGIFQAAIAQVLVKDIHPGAADALIGSYQQIVKTNINNRLYFPADDGVHGRELWRSNGVPAGTVMAFDLNPAPGAGANPEQLTVIGNQLFFVADDGTHGRELWVTSGGTPQLLELEPGPAAPALIRSLVAVGPDVYFLAETPSHGRELWKISGGGLPQAIEYAPGPGAGAGFVELSHGNDQIWGHMDEMTFDATSNAFYWFSYVGSGYELFQYELGTAAPVSVAAFHSINPHLQSPVALNGRIYFMAYTGSVLQDLELYYFEASTGNLQFHDLAPGPANSAPYHLTRFNGDLYFLANDPATPFGLDQSIGKIKGSDHSLVFPFGPSGGANQLTGVFHSLGFPNGNPFRVLGNQLLVQKNTQVWRLYANGTTNANPQIIDFSGVNINESGLIQSGAKYFYSRYENSVQPQVLYAKYNTPSTTVTSFDGECDCTLRPFVLRGGVLYFAALTTAEGWELWKIDPTIYPLPPPPVDSRTAAPDEPAAGEAGFFSLSPNPASTASVLRFESAAEEPFQATLTDTGGKILWSATVPAGTTALPLPLTNYPAGLYVITLRGEKTNAAYQKRLLINR